MDIIDSDIDLYKQDDILNEIKKLGFEWCWGNDYFTGSAPVKYKVTLVENGISCKMAVKVNENELY